MNIRRRAIQCAGSAAGVLVLAGVLPLHVQAQDGPAVIAAQHNSPAPSNALVQIVRESTRRFKNVAVAEAEGYQLMFGCVSDEYSGAMGLHYVNLSLVGDGVLDPQHPEIILYEPSPSGRLRLTGADFLVDAETWDKQGVGTPQLMGQLLHFFDSPNRFGLPPFYTLHVWAWKDNPGNTFANWHPKVSCDGFNAQNL